MKFYQGHQPLDGINIGIIKWLSVYFLY